MKSYILNYIFEKMYIFLFHNYSHYETVNVLASISLREKGLNLVFILKIICALCYIHLKRMFM